MKTNDFWMQKQKRKLGTIYCTYFKSVCLLLTKETQILRRSREIFLNKHLQKWILLVTGKNFLTSQANMGYGPRVKFNLLSQQDSFCINRLFKFSQLFDSHWKIWSMPRSEKLLKYNILVHFHRLEFEKHYFHLNLFSI